eukprot:926736-Rhodomonas_salina.2
MRVPKKALRIQDIVVANRSHYKVKSKPAGCVPVFVRRLKPDLGSIVVPAKSHPGTDCEPPRYKLAARVVCRAGRGF